MNDPLHGARGTHIPENSPVWPDPQTLGLTGSVFAEHQDPSVPSAQQQVGGRGTDRVTSAQWHMQDQGSRAPTVPTV